MELENKIAELGAASNMQVSITVNEIVEQMEEAKGMAWRIRQKNTEYKKGDKVIVPGVGNFDKILRCETAGTTADTDFPGDYNALEVGNVITDGTVEWGVVDLVTIPDTPDAPVVSVNGKTGAVVLTAQNVGAAPSNHTTEMASTTASGHVKIDGETIVAEDGVIKAVGGLPIGSIFSFPASVPPEGAYLLNGQTIANSSTLYPKFWEWVQSAGVRIISNDTYESELASAGVCGGFVVDTSAGSVRLPSVTQGTLWGADSATIGQSLAAGLPNITGSVMAINSGSANNAPLGAFWADTSAAYTEYQSSSSGSRGATAFDASRSNPIYGNSNTVQPPAIRVSWCIQVFNAATDLSEQQSAQLASEMQLKAQTDLANVDSNIDYVVESWQSADGSSWYRKFRSGWIEQGGRITGNLPSGNIVTFPLSFHDTPFVFAQFNSDPSNYAELCSVGSVDTTKCAITLYAGDSASSYNGATVSWFAVGR